MKGTLLRLSMGLAAVLATMWLLRGLDMRAFAQQLARLPAWAWAAAAAGLLAGHGLRARRLQAEWRHRGPARLVDCLRLVLTHNALVLLMPLRSGEASYVWLVGRQWGAPPGEAALSLLRWRVQDACVLVLLSAVLLLPGTGWQRAACALVLMTAGALLLPPMWSWLCGRLGKPEGPRGIEAGFGASAALWSLKVLANGGLLAGLAGLSLPQAWAAALGGELGGVLPLHVPAGLGAYEAGVWLASAAASSQRGQMVAAALAVHAFSLAVALGAAGLAQLRPSFPGRRKESLP